MKLKLVLAALCLVGRRAGTRARARRVALGEGDPGRRPARAVRADRAGLLGGGDRPARGSGTLGCSGSTTTSTYRRLYVRAAALAAAEPSSGPPRSARSRRPDLGTGEPHDDERRRRLRGREPPRCALLHRYRRPGELARGARDRRVPGRDARRSREREREGQPRADPAPALDEPDEGTLEPRRRRHGRTGGAGLAPGGKGY